MEENSDVNLESPGSFRLTGSDLIPAGLCAVISNAMAENNVKDVLSSMMDDTEISCEEFLSRTGYDLYGYLDKDGIEDNVSAVCVDGDNDGIEDIACEIYWGGSGGFTTFYFFKGMQDGSYSEPYCFDSIIEEFGFILFEGKHYLIRTSFNYNTKFIDGIDIYLYADGVLADAWEIKYQIAGYTKEITWFDGSSPEPKLHELVDAIDFDHLTGELEEKDWAPLGTAEHCTNDQNYPFASDLDNDGTDELYYKYMWYPSNMGAIMSGIVEFHDESEDIIIDLLKTISDKAPEDAGEFYTFWVDDVEDKPVIFCYTSYNNDFCIYVFSL
jgi:hypothetical protein